MDPPSLQEQLDAGVRQSNAQAERYEALAFKITSKASPTANSTLICQCQEILGLGQSNCNLATIPPETFMVGLYHPDGHGRRYFVWTHVAYALRQTIAYGVRNRRVRLYGFPKVARPRLVKDLKALTKAWESPERSDYMLDFHRKGTSLVAEQVTSPPIVPADAMAAGSSNPSPAPASPPTRTASHSTTAAVSTALALAPIRAPSPAASTNPVEGIIASGDTSTTTSVNPVMAAVKTPATPPGPRANGSDQMSGGPIRTKRAAQTAGRPKPYSRP